MTEKKEKEVIIDLQYRDLCSPISACANAVGKLIGSHINIDVDYDLLELTAEVQRITQESEREIKKIQASIEKEMPLPDKPAPLNDPKGILKAEAALQEKEYDDAVAKVKNERRILQNERGSKFLDKPCKVTLKEKPQIKLTALQEFMDRELEKAEKDKQSKGFKDNADYKAYIPVEFSGNDLGHLSKLVEIVKD